MRSLLVAVAFFAAAYSSAGGDSATGVTQACADLLALPSNNFQLLRRGTKPEMQHLPFPIHEARRIAACNFQICLSASATRISNRFAEGAARSA
jgi:hypothetical protein